MGKTDPRVDAYISKAGAFAQPILHHIRKLVHTACPEVEETIKWGFPNFDYKGIMCSIQAYKEHCSFSFWKGGLMTDPHKLLSKVGETTMGQLGRWSDLSDLPSDKILMSFIQEAKTLNDSNVKALSKPAKKEAATLEVPDYFMEELRKNPKALATFEGFSPGNKKEYVVWVVEAKTEATRLKRIETAVEWMAEGKIRNWKYVK